MSEIPVAKTNKDKVIIVEGGGMRGAFAGGALAAMCKYYPAKNFDLAVGVSAGSCSLAYYLTEDKKKLVSKKLILDIWMNELNKNKFISFRELFKFKRVMKRDYLVDSIIKEKHSLKSEKFSLKNSVPFYITVSNLKTLVPNYIKATKDNMFELLRSAISLPIATKGIHFFENNILSDGGIMDPIPIKRILDKGYKDITLVLNHPREYLSEPVSKLMSYLSFPKSPILQKFLNSKHHENYNEAKKIILNPPKDVKLKIIDPKESIKVNIITTNQKKLNYLIRHGWNEAEKFFKE